MRKSGLVVDPRYLEHRPPYPHPENPDRLEAVHARLREKGVLERAILVPPRPATDEEILLNHDERLLDQIRRTAGAEAGQLDPDTYTCARSNEIARLAAGGVLELVDRVQRGDLDNGFALVRPPGHHAEASRAMGFCLFNNIAIAAAYARKKHGIERVLAVDWDVHHGNGTQASFYTSPEMLYFSSHRYPFYPGTGGMDEVGAGEGRGFTVNVPMRAGMGDDEIVEAFRRVLVPVAEEYEPQLILVSAGFDAHRLDPLGGMRVTGAGFAALARIVKGAAEASCGGRLVLALEGGYSEEGLAESIEAVMEVLLEGRDAGTGAEGPAMTETPLGRELADAVCLAQRGYWKALRS
jgi:acetoin utilization deacetylase AcuC-like enzyme